MTSLFLFKEQTQKRLLLSKYLGLIQPAVSSWFHLLFSLSSLINSTTNIVQDKKGAELFSLLSAASQGREGGEERKGGTMWRQSALVHTRAQTIGEVLPHNALCFIQSQDREREFVNLAVGCNTVHKSNCRHRAKPLEGSHVRENKQFFFIVLYRGLKSTKYCFNGVE